MCDVGRVDLQVRLTEGGANLLNVARRSDDLEPPVTRVADVLGPRVEGDQHHIVLGAFHVDQALLMEEIAHRTGLAEVAAAPGECGADV